MKQRVSLLLFLVCSVLAHGQKVSVVMDEMTAHHLRLLPKEQHVHFDSILENRISTTLSKRIDELNYDYAFIKETYCEHDHSLRISERYFNQGDSIPRFVYFDGEKADPAKIYDGFLYWYSRNVTVKETFKPLLGAYSKFQPVQELAYDKMQVWEHGCVTQVNGAQIFEEKRTAELQSTYQVNTLIDKKSNTILVSVQYAPVEPKFETRGYNGVWDW